MLSLQLIKSITECHIIVAYIKGNSHRLFLAIDVCYMKLVGMIIYMRKLGGSEVITLLYLRLFLALIGQSLTEIAYISQQTELRFVHHQFACIADGIIEFAIVVFYHDIQLTIRRADSILLCVCTDARHQCQRYC